MLYFEDLGEEKKTTLKVSEELLGGGKRTLFPFIREKSESTIFDSVFGLERTQKKTRFKSAAQTRGNIFQSGGMSLI